MRRKLFTLSVWFVFMVSACGPKPPDLYQGTDDFPWWNDAVFYEIFIRSFYDSDGDGVGDLNGVIDKLDYLNDGDPDTDSDLGITGIWLMPIFPSPSYHGYDVTDYYSINPKYGTIEDFKRLLREAHRRGIHVVIDLVLNHTSEQHPWFVDASQSLGSEYRDWYIWSDEKPGFRGPDGQTVWHPSGDSYYYGLFVSSMPDLNYRNDQVTAEMNEITRFWLEDIGVDGFRLDAAKHLIEENSLQENTSATHDWYEEFRPFYKSINPDALVIGEVYETNTRLVKAYTEDELDLVFHFGLAGKFVDSARSELGLPAWAEMVKTVKGLPDMQYATFLTNHDQNRLMSQLSGNVNKAKTAAALLLTSPGVPFIYYGEEIGLLGQKPDEDIRRPMQWSGDHQAGFTTGTPWRDPDDSYKQINIEVQDGDPSSLLNHYRALIAFRRKHGALRFGEYITIITIQAKLNASLRIYGEENLVVLINTHEETIGEYKISVKESTLAPGKYYLSSLFGPPVYLDIIIDENGGFNVAPEFTIPGYTTMIMELAPAK